MIRVECEYCGELFDAERASAKYCCDSHKTLACRQRKEIEQAELDRQEELDRITDGIKRYDEEQRIAKEAFFTRLDEQNRKWKVEGQLQYAKKVKQEEQRRAVLADKRKKERAIEIEKANTRLQLRLFGVMAAFGVGYHLFNSIQPKDNGVSKPNGADSIENETDSGEEKDFHEHPD